MICFDCPNQDAAACRANNPGWKARAQCCGDKVSLVCFTCPDPAFERAVAAAPSRQARRLLLRKGKVV